jgi:hypothetical protein
MKIRGSSKTLVPICETTQNCVPDDHNLMHNFLISSVFAGQVKPEPLS